MNPGGNVKAITLVVDDEQIVQESVRRIFEEKGFKVDTASRVDHALDLMKKTTYDLILTDLMMPDQDGMELVRKVASDYPDTGIIMFTGYPSLIGPWIRSNWALWIICLSLSIRMILLM